MRAGRTYDQKQAALAADTTSHKELNQLRANPGNSLCADCTALKPGWASLPHGVFICIDCAQVHRSVGRHISQTKAINTGTYLWFPQELNVMKAIGNEVADAAFADHSLPPKPSKDSPAYEKMAYVAAKYGSLPPDWESAAKVVALGCTASFGARQVSAILRNVQKASCPPGSNLLEARRSCVQEQEAGVLDLISFDAEPTAPAQNSISMSNPAYSADFASHEELSAADMAQNGLTSRGNEDTHTKMKARVLAHFDVHLQAQVPPHPQSAMAFFAQYGC